LEIEIPATESYQNFLFTMNSPVTRERYSTRLRSFFVHIGIEGTTMEERCRRFIEKVKESEENGNSKWACAFVVKFLQHQKDRYDKKEIAGSTVRGYYKAIKLFTEVNDILLPWSKINRGLPRGRHYADDRIPTLDEIRKLVEYPDRRMKAIVYTMASSGIRLGAWDYLKWAHIKPIIQNEQVIAARITVYAGENEQYYSYITPEALKALQEWMDYRAQEILTHCFWMAKVTMTHADHTGGG
jgi:integrase